MLISIGEVANIFGVCIQTIRRWEKLGKIIPDSRTLGNHRIYDEDYIYSIKYNKPINQKYTICYSRVSGAEQKDNLTRQTQVLKQYALNNNYNNIKSIEDTGSGINYNKKGLNQLISLLINNKVDTLVVQYKDRLLRFGSELIFKICKGKGVKIVILENPLNKTKEEEFAMDILSIVTVYSDKKALNTV